MAKSVFIIIILFTYLFINWEPGCKERCTQTEWTFKMDRRAEIILGITNEKCLEVNAYWEDQ